MRVPVSLTLDYDFLMHLKKECRTLDIKFAAYAAKAFQQFSPRDFIVQRDEENRLAEDQRKSRTIGS